MRSEPRRTVNGRNQRPRPRRAFTLIEILVVVAIIALLVAVLLPSLSKAREQARITVCNTNLHDFGTSMHMYANNFPPYFPLEPYIGSVGSSPISDDNLLVLWYYRFARSAAIFTCPSTKHKLRLPDRIEKVPTGWGLRFDPYTQGQLRSDFAHLAQEDADGFGTSYEYAAVYYYGTRRTKVTWYHAGPPFEVEAIFKTSATLLPYPARNILMLDADDGGNVTGANGAGINNYPEPWDNHGIAGMNIMFADGHASWVRRFDLEPPGSGGKIWRQMERN
jgi:prepilin-type N-terminal cleavage/methylation domain-containing protein/prepilin-type processing-associated H-X9-DG protein